ncbi:MAG: GNAT family N-acetyltransferase [Alphaproteobacteria bacterium]|nr:GNAT family N-acetyltransferase [Alphaproteobacteria bacterium]HJM61534.1 GNAT family N-acetyltransferase [Alphaproteobacteria bacterium]
MRAPRLLAAGPADAEILAALHGVCFAEAWDAAAFCGLLCSPGSSASIVSADDAPLGFLLWRLLGEEAKVITLGVHPDHRRAGITSLLLSDAMVRVAAQGAMSMVLEVPVDNAPARDFYSGQGFLEVGSRRGYFRRPGGPPADALVLRRSLAL